MTLTQAIVAATLLLVVPAGHSGSWEAEPLGRSFPRACTPEVQKCLDKFETRLRLNGRTLDVGGVDQALRELHESDPECALLLQGAGFRGF
jgi:hypothetical protein